MPEPFSADQLIKFVSSLEQESTFKEWHNTYLPNWRSLRQRTHPVSIAGVAEVLEYRSPAIDENVDRYRNRERSADIRVTVAAKKGDTRSVQAAQRGENFLYMLYENFREESDADDEALDYQVADGLGPRNIDWATDVLDKLFGNTAKVDDLSAALKAAFTEGFHGNPFRLRVPDPQVLYWDRDMSMVAEVGPVRISSLREAYDKPEGEDTDFDEIVSDPLSTDEGDEHRDRTVQFYHVETNEYIYEAIVNSTKEKKLLLRTYPNPIGAPRYAFAAGHRTSGRQPWRAYKPLVAPLYPVVQLLNITRTLLMTGGLQTGRPMYQEVKAGSHADDFMSLLAKPAAERNVVSIDTSSGEMLPPPREGYRWESIPIPDTSILEKADERLEADIINYGFPASLAPDVPVNASSGYERAKIQESAQDYLEPALANNAAAWRQIFVQCFDAIKKVGIPVTLYTIPRAQGESTRVQRQVTLKPEDIEDVRIEVAFESIPATVRFGVDESNRRDVENGWMSESTYMATKYDDPERERKQVALDRMRAKAEMMAEEAAAAFLQQSVQKYTQQVAADLGIPMPVQAATNPARPEGGAMPGVGAPVVPPMQSEVGEPAPPNVPATEGAGMGVAP